MTKNELIKQSIIATKQKRLSQTLKVFTMKINSKKLNNQQKEQIEMLFIMAKWFYNNLLEFSQTNNLNNYDLKNNIVHIYDKNGNLCERNIEKLPMSVRQCIQGEILNTFKSLKGRKNAGLKIGHVRFKSNYNSISFKQYGITHIFKSERKIKLQGIKRTLYLYGTDQFNKDEVDIANAHLIKKPDGYYLSLVVFENKKETQTNGKILGLDFGCSTSITTSESEKFNIKIRETERLKKLQRILSKKEKGSKNFYKVKNLIEKEYQKITNKKSDIANKLVSKFKQYDIIVIQDEQLTEWHKTTSKAIQYSCLGKIKSKLKQLSNCTVLDKFLPTTKLCTDCGSILNLTLSNRIFQCNCGAVCDRDIHAAKNMIWFYNHNIGLEQAEVTPLEIRNKISEIFNESRNKEACGSLDPK